MEWRAVSVAFNWVHTICCLVNKLLLLFFIEIATHSWNFPIVEIISCWDCVEMKISLNMLQSGVLSNFVEEFELEKLTFQTRTLPL